MYVLIAYLIGATAWATTFDSSFQRFNSKVGCESAKEIIIKKSLPILESGGYVIVECILDKDIK